MRRFFLDNIELILSVAGLGVVWAAAALAPADTSVWAVAAVTALGVSVLHGAIFWVVRRRQRAVRARAIADIKEMLLDVVKNDLAVIEMQLPSGGGADARESIEGIRATVANIAWGVDALSEERLAGWQERYRGALASTAA